MSLKPMLYFIKKEMCTVSIHFTINGCQAKKPIKMGLWINFSLKLNFDPVFKTTTMPVKLNAAEKI